MWRATKNHVSETAIVREHLRVLEEAVNDCMHYDIRSQAVYEALDYLQSQSNKSWGFAVFRQGLEEWSPLLLQKGFRLIQCYINA